MTAEARGAEESGEDYISRVACRIFREQGYHATSMRSIATALGWQPAALYYYYASKEELLYSIMERAIDVLTAYVHEHIDANLPASQRLRQAIEAHVTLIAGHLDELSVFLHEMKALNPPRREILVAKRNRYEHIFRDILHDGIHTGEFSGVDPRLARFLILAACNWLYNWYRPDSAYTPQQIAGSFSDMFLYGLLPRPNETD